MATDLFKAHCSVRGWIFHSLSGGGISADCSPSGGGLSVERSGDRSSMTIELEMNLILIVCTPLYRIGKGKTVGRKRKNVSDQSNLLNCQLYIID